MTRDLRVGRAEREEMRATIKVQAARIQELEARVLEERQKTDASHAQFQATSGRLIRIVKERGNRVDGIMTECVTMADRIEEAMGGGEFDDAAPIIQEEIEPMEEDLSEDVESTSSVHLY